VIIDATHRSWALAAAVLLVGAAAFYLPYAARPESASGGSWAGLAYGICGFGLMLYAGLLGARRKVRIWRLGKAQTWMRGHLWLGLLSLPLIVLHAGFTFGEALTTVLMWLFVIVVASGLVGAWLQHTLPRRMLRDIPMETIYEQIDHVRAQLVEEADQVVADACGKLEIETIAAGPGGLSGAAAAAALASVVRVDAEDSAPLREFYLHEMRPFVERPALRHALADPGAARRRFDKVRALVPPLLHGAIADLENICEEERQLLRQSRMHLVLHGWLLVHVPLSYALLALAIVHAVVALRY
jgi:hypothetical protein